MRCRCGSRKGVSILLSWLFVLDGWAHQLWARMQTFTPEQWAIFGMPFFMSAITLWMTFMAGNKHPKAWLIGLFNQVLWLVWIVLSQSWGLLPMNIGMWILYRRNHLKWAKENKPA